MCGCRLARMDLWVGLDPLAGIVVGNFVVVSVGKGRTTSTLTIR